jgi:hypothetical protein
MLLNTHELKALVDGPDPAKKASGQSLVNWQVAFRKWFPRHQIQFRKHFDNFLCLPD